MDESHNGLGDPEYAAFAWARYRRTLGWVTLAAVAATAGALFWLYRYNGYLDIPTAIAAIVGIGMTIMIAGLLMGLIFLSSGTGHDEDVEKID